MRILIVEDDKRLAQGLQKAITAAGYAADVAHDGEEAGYLGTEEPYDLILLDLGLPRRPGLEILKEWRKAANPVPVIILTARDSWKEKVEGLKAGADDYLAKPFHMDELLARIQAVTRRHTSKTAGSLTHATFTLDEDRQMVMLENGQEFSLTGTEFRLLRYFMLHPGKILSKSRLTEHVYAYDQDRDSNVLEVYIRRLRNKLGPELIQTRRGQGYVFGEEKA
ncbi:MAG: response regulator transcription factor [Magnetococcus sp. DMHC-6]